MAHILNEIVEYKRGEVERAKAITPQSELVKQIADMPKPRNFFNAVTQSSPRINVIAEVKKASPSAGLIRPDFDPVAIATAYCDNGAVAISCLTDEKYFQGKLAYIAQIKQAVDLPVLRKDFMIDPYQLVQARAAGADAILLIAECLDQSLLIDLMQQAAALQLTILLEVHDATSLQMAQPLVSSLQPGQCLLGINNRDLRTMTTDLNHTLHMLEMVKDPSILVSESGIRTHEDIEKLMSNGVRSVLVGEHLMKQPDIGNALHQLIWGQSS